jgi:ribonuclease R
LLCNVEGARFLARGQGPDAQPVFRFHQPPDAYRLRRLEQQIRTLAKRHGLGSGGEAERWTWHRGRQSLADYLDGLPTDSGGDRQGNRWDGLARALHRQVLLAGGRSGFDSVPGIHHGVGAEVYARFTAPMREVVGVFVHKETWEQLGLVPAGDAEADEALRERVVEAANRSKGRQRKLDGEVNRRVLDQLLGDDRRRDHSRTGVVMGISRSKVHVQLDDPPIDVKVYHRHLEEQAGQRLAQGRDGVTLRQRDSSRVLLTVGETVRVSAVGHDNERDRWKLRLDPLES